MMRDHCISILRVFHIFRGYDFLVLLVCIRMHSWFKNVFRVFRVFRGYDCLVLLVCIRVHSWFKNVFVVSFLPRSGDARRFCRAGRAVERRRNGNASGWQGDVPRSDFPPSPVSSRTLLLIPQARRRTFRSTLEAS